MKIKSLLLGSAAALVAVSGARAADAVVIPEPEAVEYVRVCDAAGAGYFYIPGSETCLKISGYVRYQISANDNSDGFAKDTEGRVLFQSWTDSEYGAVTANIRFDANVVNQQTDGYISLSVEEDGSLALGNYVTMDRAYLTVGGLNMGLDTNAYDFDQDGAADNLVSNGTDRNQISYTADFGSGSFRIQLIEDDTDNFIPNVIAVVAFSAGDLGVTAAAAYDDDDGAADGVDDGDSSWGAKVAVTYMDFGASVGYSSDPGNGEDYSANYDWVIGANYGIDLSSKLNLNVATSVGLESVDFADTDYVIGAELSYALTDTFEISTRARYHSDVGEGGLDPAADTDDVDGWDWRMRFTSSF
jgi:hypothetical protein